MRILLATFRNWAWSSFLVLQESFKCLKSHISTLVKCSFYLYAFNYFGKSTRWTAQVKIHISTWRNKKPVSWVRTTYSVFQKQYFTPRNTVILSVPQVAYIAGMEWNYFIGQALFYLHCLVWCHPWDSFWPFPTEAATSLGSDLIYFPTSRFPETSNKGFLRNKHF